MSLLYFEGLGERPVTVELHFPPLFSAPATWTLLLFLPRATNETPCRDFAFAVVLSGSLSLQTAAG